ncbi:MAG: AIR synthase-related protein [Saprospiraceae bacterium]
MFRGQPVAITNCLNFGNPLQPRGVLPVVHAIKGMGDACRKFDTPVTGGNVSFYNQSVFKDGTEPVYPTPTIGMLGVLDHHQQQMTLHFKAEGHSIYLLGESREDINSSEYLRVVHQVQHSPAPYFDLEEEFTLQQHLQQLLKTGYVQSMHDVSDGGLFVALMESAMPLRLGFDIATPNNLRKDAFLFGESQSRVIISVAPEQEADLQNFLQERNITYSNLGKTMAGSLQIDGMDYGAISTWVSTYENTLGELMNQ